MYKKRWIFLILVISGLSALSLYTLAQNGVFYSFASKIPFFGKKFSSKRDALKLRGKLRKLAENNNDKTDIPLPARSLPPMVTSGNPNMDPLYSVQRTLASLQEIQRLNLANQRVNRAINQSQPRK